MYLLINKKFNNFHLILKKLLNRTIYVTVFIMVSFELSLFRVIFIAKLLSYNPLKN